MRKIIFFTALISLLLVQPVDQVQAIDSSYKPVMISSDTHPAYIKNIFLKNGKMYITADYILWYEGAKANKIFNELENDPELKEAPDGYYIINNNKRLRTFEVTADAKVYMQCYMRADKSDDIIWNELITPAKFYSLLTNDSVWDMKEYPYHLTVMNGKINKIIQQFIP